MKKSSKFFIGIAVIVIALFVITKIRGDEYLFKALWATYLHGETSATIDDAKHFKTHRIEPSSTPWDFPASADFNKQLLPEKLQKVLDETGTVAFLVIHNDSVLHEHYVDRNAEDAGTNSFSMAKSITTMLAQVAVQKNVFSGWHQKVKTILPELTGKYADELELWHLSTMSSGLDWNEDYANPWTITAKTYYGNHVRNVMLTLPIKDEPGKKFIYQSGSTELLAMCLMQATGKSLAELASEWLWKPMQTKHGATWHTDDDGTELAYCCFNSNARDFAHFGKLMLHQGNFNGAQILDSTFVQLATSPALAPIYGYSFWLENSMGTKVFYQWGFCGQYIITVPEYNLVIVRLGTKDLPKTSEDNSQYVRELTGEVLQLLAN